MTTDNIFATIGQTQANIANIQDQFFTVEKIAVTSLLTLVELS
jgi:hypothetical protein